MKFYKRYENEFAFVPFNEENFQTRDHYNRMMILPEFYSAWEQTFENIVICQLDAFLIRPIIELTKLNFKYIGASWNPGYNVIELLNYLHIRRKIKKSKFIGTFLSAGNGGLSFRNVAAMIEITKAIKSSKYYTNFTSLNSRKLNEDLAIVYFAKKLNLEVANSEYANRIFLETAFVSEMEARKCFGFHALGRWNPSLEKLMLGYDFSKDKDF